MKAAADIVVELKEDGTYEIVKDRTGERAARNEIVYGIRTLSQLAKPLMAHMP